MIFGMVTLCSKALEKEAVRDSSQIHRTSWFWEEGEPGQRLSAAVFRSVVRDCGHTRVAVPEPANTCSPVVRNLKGEDEPAIESLAFKAQREAARVLEQAYKQRPEDPREGLEEARGNFGGDPQENSEAP